MINTVKDTIEFLIRPLPCEVDKHYILSSDCKNEVMSSVVNIVNPMRLDKLTSLISSNVTQFVDDCTMGVVKYDIFISDVDDHRSIEMQINDAFVKLSTCLLIKLSIELGTHIRENRRKINSILRNDGGRTYTVDVAHFSLRLNLKICVMLITFRNVINDILEKRNVSNFDCMTHREIVNAYETYVEILLDERNKDNYVNILHEFKECEKSLGSRQCFDFYEIHQTKHIIVLFCAI